MMLILGGSGAVGATVGAILLINGVPFSQTSLNLPLVSAGSVVAAAGLLCGGVALYNVIGGRRRLNATERAVARGEEQA